MLTFARDVSKLLRKRTLNNPFFTFCMKNDVYFHTSFFSMLLFYRLSKKRALRDCRARFYVL